MLLKCTLEQKEYYPSCPNPICVCIITFYIFIIPTIFYFNNNLLVSVERTLILSVYYFGMLGRVQAAALVFSGIDLGC